MDKEIKNFIRLLSKTEFALLLTAVISGVMLMTHKLAHIKLLLLFAAAAAAVIFLLLCWLSAGLSGMYREGGLKDSGVFILLVGTRVVLPAMIFLTGLFRGDKDRLGRAFISINNIAAVKRLQGKAPSRMLMLLPHCMQSRECGRRITEDIGNCMRCGCCKIGEAASLAELMDIDVVVAKGGTAARNHVKEYRPEFIIAVACERELVSGIGDIGDIPTVGVINQRPMGYCTDTTVDLVELKKVLQELAGHGSKPRGAEYELQAKNPIA